MQTDVAALTTFSVNRLEVVTRRLFSFAAYNNSNAIDIVDTHADEGTSQSLPSTAATVPVSRRSTKPFSQVSELVMAIIGDIGLDLTGDKQAQ